MFQLALLPERSTATNGRLWQRLSVRVPPQPPQPLKTWRAATRSPDCFRNVRGGRGAVECFSEQQTVALDVVALPQPELTTDSPLCNGADVVFDLIDVSDASGCANDTTIYTWTFDDGAIFPAESGLGSVTLTAASFESLNVTIEATAEGLGGAVCPTTTEFVFELNDNPELPALPTDWSLCANGSLLIQADALSNPNGGLAYSWNNTSVPVAFDIVSNPSPLSSKATLFVADGTTASSGEVTLTAIDALGCVAEVSQPWTSWICLKR